MKTWSYGINALPEYKYGTLHLLDQPWWLAAIDWVVEHGLYYFCCGGPLAHISFPNWFPRARDAERPNDLYTLREWYGSLGDFVHLKLTAPMTGWVFERQRPYEVSVEIGYDRLRELFFERDREFFEQHERACAGSEKDPA